MIYALKYALLDIFLDKKAAKLKMYNILQVLGIAKTIYEVTLKKNVPLQMNFYSTFCTTVQLFDKP